MSKLIKLFLLLIVISWLANSEAAVPRLINYQAKLTDAAGNPLEGAYDIIFRIYDAENAGNLLWEEVQVGLIIQKGVFSTLLGSVTALDIEFDQPYWLAIKVGTDSEMIPRQQIASSGYALNADHAEETEKIKASSADTTFEYLADTADNSTLEVDATTQKLQIKDAGVSYRKLSEDTQERIIKAWVNFNGEGTIYIRDSYNVTSIVDDGTGYYTVIWNTDFADTNYVVASSAGSTFYAFSTGLLTKTMGSALVVTVATGGSGNRLMDATQVSVIAIGDQ